MFLAILAGMVMSQEREDLKMARESMDKRTLENVMDEFSAHSSLGSGYCEFEKNEIQKFAENSVLRCCGKLYSKPYIPSLFERIHHSTPYVMMFEHVNIVVDGSPFLDEQGHDPDDMVRFSMAWLARYMLQYKAIIEG